ncbi:MAG: tetraacyldisaccharide 4'-kinase [Neisseria sp.]|uniref:tetraacyldisaccharide 4'-kinase n=1 Tax=Neisseria sp. TaxID=192066 RepID=UPI0026DD5645|nr:tetraacyldisaccharide 4'-kinase [Neisseria sp.]MDO4641097.1 tetraacyldisaccharide 4'-kinase [Neisseria sp.]
MAQLHRIIERHWQQPNPLLSILLWPFSRLFAALSAQRRQRYLSGKATVEKLPVPVVVVGNIHAGGTGKTPIVAALVNALQQRGFQAGIISRGYGRKSSAVHVLNQHSTASEAGDEPLLLYRQTGAPTAVAAQRSKAGKALLAAHPDLDLIICDDGLQHYALARDMEIAVFPYVDTGRKNLDLIPNGSLREPLSRLDSVDAVIVSGSEALPENGFQPNTKLFCSHLQAGQIYRLNRPQEKLNLTAIKGLQIAAVAGIAKPERFFNTLRNIGLRPNIETALPDHADISSFRFPAADIIVITEKDAVKLSDRHLENVWVLPVCAIIKPDLAESVIQHLNLRPAKSDI